MRVRTAAALLDERLRWHARDVRAPFTLGEGYCEVGPGWWPLVRRAFEAAAAMPGAWVAEVRQKCAVLDVRLWHEDYAVVRRLTAVTDALQAKSASVCEGCGSAVPTLPPIPEPRPTRNHCDACAARRRELNATHGRGAERALWPTVAGSTT